MTPGPLPTDAGPHSLPYLSADAHATLDSYMAYMAYMALIIGYTNHVLVITRFRVGEADVQWPEATNLNSATRATSATSPAHACTNGGSLRTGAKTRTSMVDNTAPATTGSPSTAAPNTSTSSDCGPHTAGSSGLPASGT